MPIREKNRTAAEVKADVETTDKIVREDIYDVLSSFPTREDAVKGLEAWLRSVETKTVEYERDLEEGIRRILSDIDTYSVKWEDDD